MMSKVNNLKWFKGNLLAAAVTRLILWVGRWVDIEVVYNNITKQTIVWYKLPK